MYFANNLLKAPDVIYSITFDFDVKPIIQLIEESRREKVSMYVSPIVNMAVCRMDH